MIEPLLSEKSKPGLRAVSFPALDDPVDLPSEHLRERPPSLPQVPEIEIVRHFTRLSHSNFSVDTHFHPTGSCTMKYNPRVNERLSALPGFSNLHPLQPSSHVQGALELLHHLEELLCAICGMDAFSLQPAAGAHGELTALLIARAYHAAQGQPRNKVLVPASAFGTNPASARMAGFEVAVIPDSEDGLLHPEKLIPLVNRDTALVVLSNPNSFGIFEKHIVEINTLIHRRGALSCQDGSNLNGLFGLARPGDMGFDLVRVNLHQSFSTPHGGGGPGAGPLGVRKPLEEFLPTPRIRKTPENRWEWSRDYPRSIGRVRSFGGSFGILVRAYAYIRALGAEGLSAATRAAIINANYLQHQLQAAYPAARNQPCMHECVVVLRHLRLTGLTVRDVAKRILDYGFHSPAAGWPLADGLKLEPAETENRANLDALVTAMQKIAREIEQEAYTLRGAPHRLSVRRMDEVRANRQLDVATAPPAE
jgi:glycine dehydrogenase subunit 2